MPRLTGTTTCPACAEPLDPEDEFCGGCGRALRTGSGGPAGRTADAVVPASRDGVSPPGGGAYAGDFPPVPAHPPHGRPGPAPAPEAAGDFPIAPAVPAAPPVTGPHGDAGDFPPVPAHPPHGRPGPAGDFPVTTPPARPGDPPAQGRGPSPAASDPREELPPSPPAEDTPGPPRATCLACGAGPVGSDGYCENCGHAQPRPRDHMERELEGVAAVSDRGFRHHRNEDAFLVSTTSLPDGTPAVVAVVCDGVSSAYRPDDASAAAATSAGESVLEALGSGVPPERALREALVTAAGAVTGLASEPGHGSHPNSPACTCVSAVVTGPVLTVGWIGDSRVYWVPDDRTTRSARLTEDDSWAAGMVSVGLMSEAEAMADPRAHAITGWLGADALEVDPHIASFRPDAPGVLVVCTDGLWNYAESAAELAAAVPADARARPLHCAQVLVGMALDRGGHDNVTVAVLPFPATVGQAESGAV